MRLAGLLWGVPNMKNRQHRIWQLKQDLQTKKTLRESAAHDKYDLQRQGKHREAGGQ